MFSGHEACGILAPCPGMEPTPPYIRRLSLNHWWPGKSPAHSFPQSLIRADETASEQGSRAAVKTPGACVIRMWAHTLPLLVPVPSADTSVASSSRGWGRLPGPWGCAAHWAPGSQHHPWEERNHIPQENNKNGEATTPLPYDSLSKSDCPYLNLAFFTTKPEKSLHFSFLF